MEKHNILFFHGPGLYYGGTEKFLQILAKHLAKSFNVYFAYAPSFGEQQKSYFDGTSVNLLPFIFSSQQPQEPFAFAGMSPAFKKIIESNKIECVFTVVSAHYQFPINSLPASMPVIFLSPFGHFCTNGAVQKVYVSGKSNLKRMQNKGIRQVELDTHPLEDYSNDILSKSPIGERVVFGRAGRADDRIFDPIAVLAFKKLEDLYPDRVKYIVLNPPPAWQSLAKGLGIKNMEYRFSVSEKELEKFQKEIDVFAHARLDGETLGLAIIESMLAGNPILTHKSRFHNDHFDVLSPDFALWCEPDDVEQYFKNMVWVVEHKSGIRAMGQKARAKAYGLFAIDSQLPKFIETITRACEKCYHFDKRGRAWGYVRLYWENFKAIPFRIGKSLVNKFPGANKILRKFYYE